MKEPVTQSGLPITFGAVTVKPEEAHGIFVQIRICCESEDELLTHLSVIRNEVKRVLKFENEVKRNITFADDNCYG
jgi:hypothetical protein